MLSIINGNLWGGFIADLLYVNLVPPGNFLDIIGDKRNLGSTFGLSQIDWFLLQKAQCRRTFKGAGRILLRHVVVAASRWHHDFHLRSFKFVPSQLASCEGTRVPQGTKDEFWQGIDQNRPTTFSTTAFSDKSRSNSKNVKTKTNKMMGWIENGPKKIWPDFSSVKPFRQKRQCRVLDLSVLCSQPSKI